MNKPSSVLAGCFDDTVWVRVLGRGTFQNSSGLKAFCLRMVHRGYRRFVVDLNECELMDSTFMGTLAGIALRLRELGQGDLQVVRVKERNESLLSNLGLNHLFQVLGEGDPATPEPPDKGRLETTQSGPSAGTTTHATVLSAHEALVEADADNAARFRDVLEYLKQQPPPDEE